MIIVITQIRLRSVWKFFSLSNQARKIISQMKKHPHAGFKKTGKGKDHYTMSRWNNKEEMYAFVRSGAHLAAMKKAGNIALEIRTLSLERDEFPDWAEAKALLLKEGRAIKY